MAHKQEKEKKQSTQKSEKTPAVNEVPVKRQAEPRLPVRAGRPLWPVSAWEVGQKVGGPLDVVFAQPETIAAPQGDRN